MYRINQRLILALLLLTFGAASWTTLAQGPSPVKVRAFSPPPASDDPVLYWNAVMLQANANDFDPSVVAGPQQKGPTRTSRAFAIVHAAIYDAVNSIDGSAEPYLIAIPFSHHVSMPAAVAFAGYETLCSLYPAQKPLFNAALDRALAGLEPGAVFEGSLVGTESARAILQDRADDGSAQGDGPYTPVNAPGYHKPDPLHPDQGFLSADWGQVRPFAIHSAAQFRAPDFVGVDPASRLRWLNSPAYAAAYNEVYSYGRKDSHVRTAEQTEIGIFWSYDGSPQLGTPPRFYNQITRAVAARMGTSPVENARLFALVNLTMADAAIAAWYSKYTYQFWRPIMGIRNAATDGNPETTPDPLWEPLGAQADNGSGTNFTPPFPSYTSGHATIGSSMFQTLRRYFGRDDIAFSLQSDEFNGVTRDQNGLVRPARTRTYRSLSQAELENHDSRIYLGVHWRFDQDEGLSRGEAVANFVYEHILRPR